MHRRALALPTMLAAALLALAACSPSAPPLTDPVEILTKASENLSAAKTVHLEASVEGSVNLDLMGTGTGQALTLEGTKLTGDIDIEEGELQMHLEVPAMLGFTAEVVLVGGEAFVKSSMTGPKFVRTSAADVGVPVDPADAANSLDGLAEFLQQPEISPQKLDDAQCGGESCYQVAIELTPEEIVSLGGDVDDLPLDAAGALNLQVLVEKDSLRMHTMVVSVSAADMGDISLSLTMSKWDEGLDIAAPPATEVE